MTTAAKKKPAKPLEADVQKACIEIMQAAGWKVFRRNVGAFKAGDCYFRAGERGQSDVYGWIPKPDGQHVEVEIKRPGQRPSLEQVGWLLRCHFANCVAFWVDSPEQCKGIVDAINSGGWISYGVDKRPYPVTGKNGKPLRDEQGLILKADGPSGDFTVIQQGGMK